MDHIINPLTTRTAEGLIFTQNSISWIPKVCFVQSKACSTCQHVLHCTNWCQCDSHCYTHRNCRGDYDRKGPTIQKSAISGLGTMLDSHVKLFFSF